MRTLRSKILNMDFYKQVLEFYFWTSRNLRNSDMLKWLHPDTHVELRVYSVYLHTQQCHESYDLFKALYKCNFLAQLCTWDSARHVRACTQALHAWAHTQGSRRQTGF